MQLVKVLSLLAAIACLSGCATYDWSFNKAQLALDNYRHVQGSLEQGRLP